MMIKNNNILFKIKYKNILIFKVYKYNSIKI